jgi:hypothetical protein
MQIGRSELNSDTLLTPIFFMERLKHVERFLKAQTLLREVLFS